MRMKLKNRIVMSVLICFLAVWLPSVLIIFSYMNREMHAASGEALREQISMDVAEVNEELFSIIEAASWICSDKSISDAFSYASIESPGAAVDVIDAQTRIAAYMAASPAGEHLNKIVIFSPSSDISFEYVRWRSGSLGDVEAIESSKSFSSLSFPEGSIVRLMLGRTLNSPFEEAVIAYGRMRGFDAYLYAEFSMDIFEPLSSTWSMYIEGGGMVYPSAIPDELLGSSYEATAYPLSIPGCRALRFQELTPLRLISSSGLLVFLIVIAASILLFLVVSVLLSRYLTKASSHLVRHIGHLMETKDFGVVDKSIESGDEEIAAIGHAVNAMSVSISELLKRNEALFEDKKRMEIDMLQMQVNPHFLYNTLESMHYLAEVQRNDGIARMSRGLSTLLRNMAKGTGDRILLSEELSLLHDYDEIQQVRYMGMYEIAYDVPEEAMDLLVQKFTLQPLVENAIFHGIEPSGRCGTIVVSAAIEGCDLVLTVADDGVGMDGETMERIYEERRHSKTNMTGIGVRNIHERIRLMYGDGYGLSFASEIGKGTKAMARIKAERRDDA